MLRDFEMQKLTVETQRDCGILSSVDATLEVEMIEKKENRIKESLIKQYHVSKNGTPRKIVYLEEKKLYTTYMPNASRLYAPTLNELYDKLIKYYDVAIHNTSFKEIFNLALDEQARTENLLKKTIDRKQDDYKRFINSDFGKRDIRQITIGDLKEYSQNLVNSESLIISAFKKYKGVLYLAFNYAHAKGIIQTNPVVHLKNSVYIKSCDSTKEHDEETKIHSVAEIEQIKDEVRKRMSHRRYKGYFINGYAILLSIETGVRCGELCALKWEDVKDTYIHIHSQQLEEENQDGKKGRRFYLVPYTKNEKGISKKGRKFPLTQSIKALLNELKALQEELNIHSEFIFFHEDGEWIKTRAYQSCLREMCKKLGMNVTNNHAFRMSLNSNVFIPLGIPETERARLLGHSVETNLKYYSFGRRDNLQDICDLLNQSA